MNKKGFTLIELLSTITIMTVIATMVCINVVKIFDNKDKEEQKSKENIITNAACIYIELSKNNDLKEKCLSIGCDISSNDLIKEGILNEEDVDNFKIIHIEKENNEKKCTIK